MSAKYISGDTHEHNIEHDVAFFEFLKTAEELPNNEDQSVSGEVAQQNPVSGPAPIKDLSSTVAQLIYDGREKLLDKLFGNSAGGEADTKLLMQYLDHASGDFETSSPQLRKSRHPTMETLSEQYRKLTEK